MKPSTSGKGGYAAVRPRRRRAKVRVVASAAIVALLVAGIAVKFSSSDSGTTAYQPAATTGIFTPDGSVISKEPVLVAGVQVDEPSVNLGRQPLNTAVERTFKLRNTGSTSVTLGRANIEVLEGCCPEDPILKTNRIEPGEEVPLLFSLPMGMHKGMDGPHLFRLTVPVRNGAGETGLVEIYVKADFG